MRTRVRREEFLHEMSLGRIYAHTKREVVILSSNQGREPEVKERAFLDLESQVRSAGAGFIELDGVRVDSKTGETVVMEKSGNLVVKRKLR